MSLTEHRKDATKNAQPNRVLTRINAVSTLVIDEVHHAHAKHGDNSMLSASIEDATRLAILVEEVGEVANCLNERRLGADIDQPALMRELIQVAAVATGWTALITTREDVQPYEPKP